MRVVVFGAGYVGLVTGTVLAYVGHDVTLVDVREEVVAAVQQGLSPIYEPGLEPLLKEAVARGKLRADLRTTAVSTADALFIAVGTPPLQSGAPNLTSVEKVARAIGEALQPSGGKPVIINKATVPVGSTHLVEVWVTEGSRGRAIAGEHFAVASNPEFLREGTAVYDTLYPDRIVFGTEEDWVRQRLQMLYAPIIEQQFVHPAGIQSPLQRRPSVPVVMVDSASSEMIKYAANAFLATKISFANEIAGLCELVGADVVQVMTGIGLDARIGTQFLQAGVGWGGSCFGKDVSALLSTGSEYDHELALLEAVRRVNTGQRLKMVQHVRDLLRPVKGRLVAIWGLAFKPETDDVRDAPAYTVIRELLNLGVRISAFDPVASGNFRAAYPDVCVRYLKNPFDALKGADALMILTDWRQFKQVNLRTVAATLSRPILIDGRNCIDPDEAEQVGLIYRGVGRAPSLLVPALGE